MSLLRDPSTQWSAALLIAVVLLVTGIVMVKTYAVRSVDDQAIGMEIDSRPAEREELDQKESGPLGAPGSPGWKLLDLQKSADQISMTVHHVIASPHGIYAVYSVKVKSPNDHLDSTSVTRHIADGKMIADPTADYLVGADDRATVRIASLGKPSPGVSRYGMNVAVDTNKGTADISLDVVESETPGIVRGGVSFMTNPEATYLLHGGYWVIGPQGTTFGVSPGSVIATEDKPSYFMISPEGALWKIKFKDLVDFNEQHTP